MGCPYYMETTCRHAFLYENSMCVLYWQYTSFYGNVTWMSSSIWKFCGVAFLLWKYLLGNPFYMEIL